MFDVIARKPEFYIAGNKSDKSCFGAFLSIIIVICTFGTSIYFGREIWEKKNPIVNTSKVTENPEELVLDKNEFDFTFGMLINNKFTTDPTLFSLSSSVFMKKEGEFINIPFKMEECRQDSLLDKNIQLYQEGLFSSPINISDVSMNGTFGQDGFRLINFQFFPCKNDTSNIACKSQEEIDTLLSQAYFSVFASDHAVYTNNYTSPYQAQVFNDFVAISQNSFTGLTLFISPISVISDVGFLFSDLKDDTRFGINNLKILYSFKPNESGMFLELGFQLTNFKSVYYRKYLKLQELMAQIGGVANLFMIISSALNYLPSIYNFRIRLINLIFNFDKDMISPNYAKEASSASNLIKTEKDDPKNLRMTRDNAYNLKLSTFNNNFLNTKKKTDLKLKYSTLDGFLMCFYSKEKNYLRIMSERGFKAIKYYLSLETLIKLSRDVSRMQYLSFSTCEQTLFSMLENPLLTNESENLPIKSEFEKYSDFLNKGWIEAESGLQSKIRKVIPSKISNSSGLYYADKMLKVLE